MKTYRKLSASTVFFGLIILMLSSTDAHSETNHRANLVSIQESLGQLLTELEVAHEPNFTAMMDASQQWRRKPGQERWELNDISLSAEKMHRVFHLLKQLRMTDPVYPTIKEYDYVLLLGSTAPGMLQRLQHLTNLWNDGYRFKQLIYLVSQRPLQQSMDQSYVLANWAQTYQQPPAQTETDAARLLHQLTNLPAAMATLPVEFIDTPGQIHEGRWYRPNTRATVVHWLKQQPLPGSVLVITDQPHGNYQETVVRQALPDGFSVDLSTGSAKPSIRLVIYLDALALWLHNLQQSLK